MRRIVLEVAAVTAIGLALAASVLWAGQRGDGEKPATTTSPQHQVPGMQMPTWMPTPDPNKPHARPGYHMVGAHQCYVPEGAVGVLNDEAVQKGGRVFDDGSNRYYLTASGRCITIADDVREDQGWIPPALEARLQDPNDFIWPCQIPDSAVEVFSDEIAEYGARVFDHGTDRTYVLADGQCITWAGGLAPFARTGVPYPTPGIGDLLTPRPSEIPPG